MPNPVIDALTVTFSPHEACKLEELASLAGQTPEDYVRARALSEARIEEQILRFLSGELTALSQRVIEVRGEHAVEGSREREETPHAQKARIVKEVRASLTDAELATLAEFFRPAFGAELKPGAATGSGGELYLHPHGNQWIGVVYAEGGKLGEIAAMSSREAVENAAAERFGAGLEPVVWSQDGGMILSEK